MIFLVKMWRMIKTSKAEIKIDQCPKEDLLNQSLRVLNQSLRVHNVIFIFANRKYK